MYFDTHAHYDADAFDADRDELLAAMPANGVKYIVDPGCDEQSSRAAVAIAERHPFVYAAVGWQPQEWSSWTENSISIVRELAAHPKVVAIGEIGLDYYWEKDRKEIQQEMLSAQLELALELDLPVIMHDRESHADCMEVTGRYPELRGVFHCFSGSREMAQELIKRGWYLGFDGPVTYKNARHALEVLEYCPTERILLETDSPYLTPVPFRGKRNDSTKLKLIAEKVAQIKGMSVEEVARVTCENAQKLFRID